MTVTLVPERLARLDTITLDKGSHESPEQGMCFIEFADWLAGGPGRDNAPTVSPVIRAYGIALNDAWDAEQRQKLRPYGPRVVGTAGDGQDPARFILARQALLTDLLPAWLALAGMDDEIASLQGQTDPAEIRAALRKIREAAWARRRKSLKSLQAKVRELLATKPAAGVAADAGAAAGVAVGVAAAAAAAAGAAADAAVAVGVDAAAAAGVDAWGTYDVAYEAARKAYAESTDPIMVKVRELGNRQQQTALTLLDRMISPASVAS